MKAMIKKIMAWILKPRKEQLDTAFVIGYIQGAAETKEIYSKAVANLTTKVMDVEAINMKNSAEIENLRCRLEALGAPIEERILQ